MVLCCVERGERAGDGRVGAEECGDLIAGEVAAEAYVKVGEAGCGGDGEEGGDGDGGV